MLLELIGFFALAGTLGIALANFELKKPKNKYGIKREDAKVVDWLSIFFLSGVFGLVLPFALEQFMFDGDLSNKLFFVFTTLGAMLREGIFPMIFHAMGRVANNMAKYYNESINEDLNSNTTDSGQDTTNTTGSENDES